MMNVKILKVAHRKASEARKVFPYIREANLFCSESALLTASEAQAAEVEWRKFLASGMSRSAFKRNFEKQNPKVTDDRDYRLEIEIAAYRAKVPVWYLERFNPREKAALDWLYTLESRLGMEAYEALSRGDEEQFLAKLRGEYEIKSWCNYFRDLEMARNLDESRIREAYPQLPDDLEVVLWVGAFHQLESFVEYPVEVVNLFDPDGDIDLWKEFVSGTPLEEVRPAMLEVGYRELPSKEPHLRSMREIANILGL